MILWGVLALTAAAMALGAWFGRKQLLLHPISAFALLLVAVIVGYVMWMGFMLNQTLASPGWCRTALGADKATSTDGTVKGLDACVSLLTIQLKSESTNSHIYAAAIGLALLVLVVIVIARGKLDLTTPWGGGSVSSGREAVKAADKVAGAAVVEAAKVKTDVALGADAEPPYNGPAMPEPKGD